MARDARTGAETLELTQDGGVDNVRQNLDAADEESGRQSRPEILAT